MASAAVLLLASAVPAAGTRVSSISMRAWDGGRALRTAVFFNNPLESLSRLVGGQAQPARPDGVVWDASSPELLTWGPLDDVVMGGVSQSAFTVEGGVGVFAGEISVENNGGFAGCRSKALSPALDLSGYAGVRLRVRGDGQRYKLIVRDDYEWSGIAWAYSFDTDAKGETLVEVPFTDFVCAPRVITSNLPRQVAAARADGTRHPAQADPLRQVRTRRHPQDLLPHNGPAHAQ